MKIEHPCFGCLYSSSVFIEEKRSSNLTSFQSYLDFNELKNIFLVIQKGSHEFHTNLGYTVRHCFNTEIRNKNISQWTSEKFSIVTKDAKYACLIPMPRALLFLINIFINCIVWKAFPENQGLRNPASITLRFCSFFCLAVSIQPQCYIFLSFYLILHLFICSYFWGWVWCSPGRLEFAMFQE